jgi:hypothetical protein
MKAQVEAMRALAYVAAAALDRAEAEPDAARAEQAKRFAELLNPIVKGWCTETGTEVASMGVQVHGGMGYVEETGAAQHLRDARITTIYEGTTAIQANDLINRKILRDTGATLFAHLDEVAAFAESLTGGTDDRLKDIGTSLVAGVADARKAVRWLIEAQAQDPRHAAAAAVPLLMLLGTVLGGYQLGRAAKIAAGQAAQPDADTAFLSAKVGTAWHYAESILPRSAGFLAAVIRGARTVMVLATDQL